MTDRAQRSWGYEPAPRLVERPLVSGAWEASFGADVARQAPPPIRPEPSRPEPTRSAGLLPDLGAALRRGEPIVDPATYAALYEAHARGQKSGSAPARAPEPTPAARPPDAPKAEPPRPREEPNPVLAAIGIFDPL